MVYWHLDGAIDAWYGRGSAFAGFPLITTYYCCAVAFGGCFTVPCKMTVRLAGGCFGFGTTYQVVYGTDGKYHGTGTICSGASVVTLTVDDFAFSSTPVLYVDVDGTMSSVTLLPQGCSPPTWNESFQPTTLGGCCGTGFSFAELKP